jgi:hypothetical protein
MGCDGAKIRVGDETRGWQDGKIIIFDDSFEHEVRHEGAYVRSSLHHHKLPWFVFAIFIVMQGLSSGCFPSPPPFPLTSPTGSATRFVLIFDIWHPDFSADEVRFIDTL